MQQHEKERRNLTGGEEKNKKREREKKKLEREVDKAAHFHVMLYFSLDWAASSFFFFFSTAIRIEGDDVYCITIETSCSR